MYRGVYFSPLFCSAICRAFFSVKIMIERLIWEVWPAWHWWLCVNWSIFAWPKVRSEWFTMLKISRGEYYVHFCIWKFLLSIYVVSRQGCIFVTIVLYSYLQDTSSFWRLFWDVGRLTSEDGSGLELLSKVKSAFKDQDIAAGARKKERVRAFLLDRCF